MAMVGMVHDNASARGTWLSHHNLLSTEARVCAVRRAFAICGLAQWHVSGMQISRSGGGAPHPRRTFYHRRSLHAQTPGACDCTHPYQAIAILRIQFLRQKVANLLIAVEARLTEAPAACRVMWEEYE